MTPDEKRRSKENLRIQKESFNAQFKQRARTESLMNASRIDNSTCTTEDLLKEAEKIYQWLIKDL